MAGSIRWFPYTMDNGDIFGIKADESNTEAVNGTSIGVPASIYSIPKNIKPRYGLFRSADGLTTRKCYFTSRETYDAAGIGTTISVNGVTLYLSRKVGEIVSSAKTIDTGLTDGDNP